MPDYNLPMEATAAKVPQAPIQAPSAQIPMSVEPFKAIDPMANEQKATALAMQQSQLKEQQSQEKMQAQEQEDMTKDRTKLQAYNDSGGNLHTVEGIDDALKEGGWSQKTIAGLIARKEAIQKNSIEFQKALHEQDTNKTEQMYKVMQETLKQASVPSDKYEKALADGKDETEAAKVFNTEIQALITSERANIDPATGKPRMGEDKLNAMAKMSPQDWKEKIKEGDYKVKQVALNLATRKSEAEIKKNEELAKKAEAEAARIAKSGPIGEKTGGPVATPYADLPEQDQRTVDYYAKQSLGGDNSWQVGLARGAVGQQLIQRVKDRIPQLASEAGQSPMDAIAAKASVKADSAALTQNNKDLTSIRPYKKMLDKNVDIAIELGKKIVQSDSKFANKSINWIKQNAADNPDTAEYLAQMHFVQTEGARVLNNPRLVGVLSMEAKKDMNEIISGNMPLNSAERVLRRIQLDGNNRVDAMTEEHDNLLNRITGKKTEAPDVKDETALKKAQALDSSITMKDIKEARKNKEAAAPTPASTSTITNAAGHPAVAPAAQKEMDVEAGKTRVSELGGLEPAKAHLVELKAAIQKAPKDQRVFLEQDAAKLEAGIKGMSGTKAAPSAKDAEAIAWAKANANDPRAKQIMALHGM